MPKVRDAPGYACVTKKLDDWLIKLDIQTNIALQITPETVLLMTDAMNGSNNASTSVDN